MVYFFDFFLLSFFFSKIVFFFHIFFYIFFNSNRNTNFDPLTLFMINILKSWSSDQSFPYFDSIMTLDDPIQSIFSPSQFSFCSNFSSPLCQYPIIFCLHRSNRDFILGQYVHFLIHPHSDRFRHRNS